MSEVAKKKSSQSEIADRGIHPYGRAEDWVIPCDKEVLQKTEWFRDQKLGLFLHFGLYTQIGGLVSWMLSDEDKEWSYRDFTWDDPKKCQQQYKNLNRSFNPIRLQPDEWAQIAQDAGVKYLIMTTKHHDGFCLFDTQQTEYKVTDEQCPFSLHPYADVIKHVFEAFRRKQMGIMAYFSKADWASPYYWNPETMQGETSRHANYDTDKKPELWNKFVEYTHAQMMELVDGYGPFDGFWLDAGWVNAREGEDIRLEKIASEARKKIPGLLFVDRTVGGALENYLTPECTVPPVPMDVPWESCITLERDEGGWGYTYAQNYKSAREILHLLIEIVAKGGNLALGVGPQPDGRLPQKAVGILMQLGQWLRLNGESIYNTRICAPHIKDAWAFTKNETHLFAIRLIKESEEACTIKWLIPLKAQEEILQEKKVQSITLLHNQKPVSFEQCNDGIYLQMKEYQFLVGGLAACAFKIELLQEKEI